MPLIQLPPTRSSKEQDLAIAKKANKRAKATTAVRGGSGIASQIARVKDLVFKNLGAYEKETVLIRDELELSNYITNAIATGEIAIDTETTGLDPMLDTCVGVCLYSEGQKSAYIPMNHISYITMEKVDNQLPKEVVAKYLQKIADTATSVIMFNASFDIRVIKNQIGVRLHCYWDCQLASRLLNENEQKGEGGLKALHRKYVLNNQEDAFSFTTLFDNIKFNLVPINVGYLYAAHDAKITYELYQFQKQYLYYEPDCALGDRDGLNGVAYTFFNIEMPCVDVVVDMEDMGVALDVDYAKELSVKYNKILGEKLSTFYGTLEPYEGKIRSYRRNNPDCKLDDPVNIASSDQLSVLLYQIVGLEPKVFDKKTGMPIYKTGEEILSLYDDPICKAILEWRGISKLISTYIDKLPRCLNPNDHRVHCKFNQYGADTGRMSSSDPNLQNIPSHNKDIRKMFVATSREYIVEDRDNCFLVNRWCEVETPCGFVSASRLQDGDVLLVDNNETVISKVEVLVDKNQLKLYC